MNINPIKSAVENLVDLIKDANPGLSALTTSNVTFGVPEPDTSGVDNNSAILITAVKNKGFSGSKKVHYKRLKIVEAIEASGLTQHSALTTLETLRTQLCSELGLVSDQVVIEGALTGRPELNYPVYLKGKSGSAIYLEDAFEFQLNDIKLVFDQELFPYIANPALGWVYDEVLGWYNDNNANWSGRFKATIPDAILKQVDFVGYLANYTLEAGKAATNNLEFLANTGWSVEIGTWQDQVAVSGGYIRVAEVDGWTQLPITKQIRENIVGWHLQARVNPGEWMTEFRFINGFISGFPKAQRGMKDLCFSLRRRLTLTEGYLGTLPTEAMVYTAGTSITDVKKVLAKTIGVVNEHVDLVGSLPTNPGQEVTLSLTANAKATWYEVGSSIEVKLIGEPVTLLAAINPDLRSKPIVVPTGSSVAQANARTLALSGFDPNEVEIVSTTLPTRTSVVGATVIGVKPGSKVYKGEGVSLATIIDVIDITEDLPNWVNGDAANWVRDATRGWYRTTNDWSNFFHIKLPTGVLPYVKRVEGVFTSYYNTPASGMGTSYIRLICTPNGDRSIGVNDPWDYGPSGQLLYLGNTVTPPAMQTNIVDQLIGMDVYDHETTTEIHFHSYHYPGFPAANRGMKGVKVFFRGL